MVQLYILHLKCIVKDVQNMFWSLCFPIILATLFHAAFSNLSSTEAFDTVPVAVVQEEGSVEEAFLQSIRTCSLSDDKKLFDVTVCSKEQAEKLLKDSTISGYITTSDSMKLVVKDSGINETIIKTFLDSYGQTQGTIQTIASIDPQIAMDQLIADIQNGKSYVNDESNQGSNPDTSIVLYYALIAMTCLLGSHIGNKVITDIQADLSAKGARIHVAPIHKMKLLLCNLLAAFTVQLFNVGVLMSYLYYILKIDFGNQLYYIGITCFFASLVGVMIGAMITAVIKKNENIKQSLLTLISVGGGALAGLMIPDVKYIVDTQMPFVAFINPANLIADALYRLYYYGPDQRFMLNISILGIMSVVFTVITYWTTRREEYASL